MSDNEYTLAQCDGIVSVKHLQRVRMKESVWKVDFKWWERRGKAIIDRCDKGEGLGLSLIT